jgi:hypothetical protein
LYSEGAGRCTGFFPDFFHELRGKNSGIVLRLGQENRIKSFYPVLSSLIPELHSIQTEKLTASWKSLERKKKEKGKKENG